MAAPEQDRARDGSVMEYRYRLPSEIPAAVLTELRLRHQLGNKLVELWQHYRAAVAAAWEEDPQIAPLLAAEQDAARKADEATAAAAKAAKELGYAKQRGTRARITAAQATARDTRDARASANKTLKAARQAIREMKALRFVPAQHLMSQARAAYDQAVKDTYQWFHAEGGYWVNWVDAVSYHKTAAGRVEADRARGQPAELRFRRWDGTGTVTVQLQRLAGVTADQRAEVTARKAAGETPQSIAADLGMTPAAVARMKPAGRTEKADPPRSPRQLAAAAGKWRNVLAVSGLPSDFDTRPRGERRAIARQGTIRFRTGSEEHRAVSELPAVLHRPMREDADVACARITVTRQGPVLLMHVSLTAKLPKPPRQAGGLVCVHAGWRVLPDGSLRVAAISGAGQLPASLAAPAGPGGGPSALDGCVRHRYGFREVIIPAGWRAEHDRIQAMRSARDKARDAALAQTAAWIETHPRPVPDGDGLEPLPEPHLVRQWKAPARLAALGRACQAGVHGQQARELGALIGAWADPDLVAWRAEAKARARLLARRDDLYGRVAAWVCAAAGEVRVDEWDMRDTARRPRADDGPQAAAARANRVLAAPGDFRRRVQVTAALKGVQVTTWKPGERGQVHSGCGGTLDPDERRGSATVRCGTCERVVDQDGNMLMLMAGG
jgi:hypothetical protein